MVPTPDTTSGTDSPCTQDDNFDTQLLVLAGICVIVGLIMCLMGYKLFKFILFLTGFAVGFFATYVFCTSSYFEEKLHGDAKEHKDQIALAMSFGVGVIGGILTLCLYYVGMFALGASMGWFAGMSLLPFFKSQAHFLASNVWLPYSICVGCAVLGGLLILCLQKTIIILATSFLGALMVINGLDYYIEKGRVLTFTVNILQGNDVNFPSCWYTWLVLSFLPILSIIGIIVQHVKTSKGSDHRIASGQVLVVDAHAMYEIEHEDDESTRPLLSQYA